MPGVVLPIGIDDVSRAMAVFAPFEARPVVAVAVSGGPDSMALLLLLDRWAHQNGGSVLALTVDHGLRADSRAEARQVASWAAERGIAHEILDWTGEKPSSGIQAAARAARYGLLADACAARGILHLAFAHHADDQAETVLFRAERGSGAAGLAGMTASRSLGPARLIRPLLGWPKSALIDCCAAFGQAFFEDPSNRSDRFARTGLRSRLALEPGLRESLLEGSRAAAHERSRAGNALAAALGLVAEMHPYGAISIALAGVRALQPDMRRAVMSATLRTIGGQAFAPEDGAVERLVHALQEDAFAGISLAGCVVRERRGCLLVCREPARTEKPVTLAPRAWRRWDGRFLLRTDAAGLTVGALGLKDYAKVRRRYDIRLPAIVGAGLPALRLQDRLLAVPAVGWAEQGSPGVEQHLLPLWPLSPETFTVVYAGPDIMSV